MINENCRNEVDRVFSPEYPKGASPKAAVVTTDVTERLG